MPSVMKNTDHTNLLYLFSFGNLIAKTNIAIINAIHTATENIGVFICASTRTDILPNLAQCIGTIPLKPVHIIMAYDNKKAPTPHNNEENLLVKFDDIISSPFATMILKYYYLFQEVFILCTHKNL